MRRALHALAVALALVGGLGSCAAVQSRERDAAVTLHYGQVEMIDDDKWNRADDQEAGAVVFEWPMGETAWSHEVGVGYYDAKSSPGLNAKFETRTTELTVGAKRRFGPWWRTIHPYLGVGGAVLYTEQEFQPALGAPAERDVWDGGLYASAGLWGDLVDGVRIGTEVRVLAEDWFDSRSPHLDQTRVTFTLGYGF